MKRRTAREKALQALYQIDIVEAEVRCCNGKCVEWYTIRSIL